MQNNVCSFDSTAKAFYLFDLGEAKIEYADRIIRSNDSHNDSGFEFEIKRHYRIKVLDNSYSDIANVVIRLEKSNGKKQEIKNLSAVTYNIENNKILKSKLKKNQIFEEEIDDYENQLKFALPNVKKGSILEVKYTLKSDYIPFAFNFEFQRQIPVAKIDYKAYLPEFYTYNQTLKGYLGIDSKQYTNSKILTITYQDVPDRAWNARGSKSTKTEYLKFPYLENYYHYSASKLPSFEVEPYLNSQKNYRSRVEFELAFTKNLNKSRTDDITTSWEEISKELWELDEFGSQFKKTKHLQKLANKIRSKKIENKLDLILECKKELSKVLKWDEYNSIFCDKSISSAFKAGNGNAAQINISLINLLKLLEFNVTPVVLSTRSHGLLKIAHPSIRKLNYIVAKVNLEGKYYLLDATDPYSTLTELPIRCRNDFGVELTKDFCNWIDLKKGAIYKSQSVYTVNIDESLKLHGKLISKKSNYAAYNFRSKFENDYEYARELEKKNSGLSIDSISSNGKDDLNSKIEQQIVFSHSEAIENVGDLIFVNPLFFSGINNNPFTTYNRNYPVDLPYKRIINVSSTIEVPENIMVETLPQTSVITLPENGGRFMYQASQFGNSIKVSATFMINKNLFIPEEYELLKEMYDLVVDKCSDPIILKYK